MKLLFQLLLLCIVFISVFGKRPSRNPKYEEAQGLAGETKAPYAKYDTITITMHARDNITKQTWKSTYYPRVDEFTRLELVGTAEQGFTSNPNLTVWLEFPTYPNQTKLKDLPKRVYKHNVEDEENPVVVLYYTAIVLLDQGNIVDFKWDDGCGGCAKKLCIDEQCGAEIKKDNFCSEETNCNIKVYLVWMGRDKDDAKCRSISSRPNSFSKYSVTPITNFGNSLFSSTIFNFKSNAPNPLSDQA